MNQELFENMQKQMTPSPEVRAALSEKLAQAPKKRPAPWKKYAALAALAACAALVIGAFSLYNFYQDKENWTIIVRNFQRDPIELTMHSYVTVDGPIGYIQENAATNDTGTGAAEILPGGAYVGDVPVQEGAEDYQKLMDHFDGYYPNWYGGAYLNGSGRLVVHLVESEDPGDKSLELQVLDWTGSDNVMFSSCKYSLAHLNQLMDRLNRIPTTHPYQAEYFAGWGIDEEYNRIVVSLTEAEPVSLSVLAGLDPDDDAIYVQVGQRASVDSAKTEDPAVHHAVPGGVTVPDDDDLIADEPVYDGVRDGAHYDVEDLPQQKQPAYVEDASTSSYDPDAK